jgi:archaemetzincin
MKENLFPDLEQGLAPSNPVPRTRQASAGRGNPAGRSQPFDEYRRSRPARQTARRQALYLSRVGALTNTQESIVTATAEYLALFFDLPVRSGADFDPTIFPSCAQRRHPVRAHPQLLTHHLINEVLWLDRPEEALICLAVTAWDLWSADQGAGQLGYVFGEAYSGHAGVWSLCYLGDPGRSERVFRHCLRRSFALASHEALHVLGLDHCTDMPCTMNGSCCLSGPLHLCPPCLRKLCWNRQLDLPPYLQRLADFLDRWGFTEEAERYRHKRQLLQESGPTSRPG